MKKINSDSDDFQNINMIYAPNEQTNNTSNNSNYNGNNPQNDYIIFNSPNIPSQNEVQNLNRFSIIKNSVVLQPINSISLFNVLKDVGASIYYNFNKNPKFNEEKAALPIQIFNTNISSKFKEKSELISAFNTVLYMTYRSSFPNLLLKNYLTEDVITSDNGWGCMIRSCQMMLSKGILERKMYKYKRMKNVEEVYYMIMLNLRKETLLLFYDNYVSLDKSISHPDYQYFYDQFSYLVKEDKTYQNILGVFPPFSIQTLCDVSKCAGNWTSDLKIIKAIIEINKQFMNEEDCYIYFENGMISEKKLFASFCKEKTQNSQNLNTLEYKGKLYTFVKGGLIFISLRLGLSNINIESIPTMRIFFCNMKNNIGFVGGRNGKAYYFIGFSEGKFMYLDPHFNQKAVDPEKDEGLSYYIKDVYLLDPSELSSQLTLGIVINNQTDLINFIKDVNEFSIIDNNFISITK